MSFIVKTSMKALLISSFLLAFNTNAFANIQAVCLSSAQGTIKGGINANGTVCNEF
jgi:hypothetical protein